MGKEVEAVALSRGHTIAARVTSAERPGLAREVMKDCDIAIEFTRPEAVVENLEACFDAGLPVVTGTTGWHTELDRVKKACDDKKGSLLYASNFSLGVNVLFDINRRLAALMGKQPAYRVSLEETHHIHKLDRPSGTAVSLAEDIVAANERLVKWALAEEAGETDDVLPVTSLREGEVTGKHKVTYTSDIDLIEIKHEAFNRRGFATGSVLAAEWLKGRQGVFTMRDYMEALTQV